MNESYDLANEYIEMAGNNTPSNFADYVNWTSNLKVIFLSKLEASFDNLTHDILSRIDADLNISATVDPECK